jgi:signal transduction histidine kinase
LSETKVQLERLRSQLSRQEKELNLIDRFGRALAQATTVEAVIATLAEHVRELLTFESLVVFLAEEGELVPLWVDSRQQERLEHAALLDLKEPIIVESWQHGLAKESTSQPLHDETRIFHLEASAATFLLGDRGLLYLGRKQPGGFPASSTRLVLALTRQATLALQSVERSVALREALAKEQAMVQELQAAYQQLEESEISLVQSSKLAAVGQLAAGVAHELNTPLATVLLEVEGLEMDLAADPDVEQALKKMSRELLRAQEIVANLLYYSSDARKGDKSVDLNKVVRDSIALVGHQLREGGSQLEVAATDQKLLFRGNANEVQQIILNLLLNARDATADTKGVVKVETGRSEGETVVLMIKDNGTGVPTELAERLFDPFFTTKPVGKGTGLGLTISRRLAERHGGNLEYKDLSGETAFILSLPAEQGDDAR